MTKKEFILERKAFEEGIIRGYTHILKICKAIIKVHKEELTKKRLEELAEMNKHLWKK